MKKIETGNAGGNGLEWDKSVYRFLPKIRNERKRLYLLKRNKHGHSFGLGQAVQAVQAGWIKEVYWVEDNTWR